MSAFLDLNMGHDEDDGRALSDINTTPLVDVMLVLLIVFMITIPVITQTVPVDLPEVSNEATKTKPENINISVNKEVRCFGIRSWFQTTMIFSRVSKPSRPCSLNLKCTFVLTNKLATRMSVA